MTPSLDALPPVREAREHTTLPGSMFGEKAAESSPVVAWRCRWALALGEPSQVDYRLTAAGSCPDVDDYEATG